MSKNFSNARQSQSTNALNNRVPKKQMAIVKNKNGEFAPVGYTKRPVVPAEKAELISVARAMNGPDFEPKLRQLFNAECQAANTAIETGLYIGYRCPEQQWDCIRVTESHKCFCGHLLSEHEKFDGRKHMLKCGNCKCKRFSFVPSRPEDVGEFWYARRKDFDVSTYRVKCRCKHAHDQHDPVLMNCTEKGCGCSAFNSDFLCAACDNHWERHETFLETEKDRRENKMPYGENYRPFNEMKELKNVLYDDRNEIIAIEPMPDSLKTNNQIFEYPAMRKRDDYILNINTRRQYPEKSKTKTSLHD